jgi:hypothetical protein
MNHLAFFALAITDLREREAEREIELRRKRVGDDDAPKRIRDRAWAAAIHRWVTAERETALAPSAGRPSTTRTDATPSAQAGSAGAGAAGAGAATLGCASA